MNEKQLKRISKFLSLILRHKPEKINIKLDNSGYADVSELLEKGNLSFDDLKFVVENNNKKRFAFNNDFTKIRASQGHSIKINLSYKSVKPPEILFHGTSTKNIKMIKTKGLMKMKRQHVHLSADTETAINVGERHGKPVVLKIMSGKMHEKGLSFYLSENKVWLTNHVPKEYIKFE